MKNENTVDELKFIKGVGPKRAEALFNSGIFTVNDLINYFPTSYINRENAGTVSEIRQTLKSHFNPKSNIFNNKNEIKENILNENSSEIDFRNFAIQQEFSIIGKIVNQQIREFGKNKKMLILTVADSSDEKFEIVFFNMADYFKTVYSENTIIAVSGKPTLNEKDKWKISFLHPEIDIIETEDIEFYSKGGIIPKYKITEEMRKAGITIRVMRKIISNVLNDFLHRHCEQSEAIHSKNKIDRHANARNDSKTVGATLAVARTHCVSTKGQPQGLPLQDIEETLPENIIKKLNLPSISETIQLLHKPQNMQQIGAAQYRIKFEELFWYQLLLNINRAKISQKENGILIEGKSKLARQLYDSLPFELTSDQKKVLREFAQDFSSGKPMNRLLQGDVGSGKTIVAILAMLMVVDAGFQVVLMAPTEILAEQHYNSIKNYKLKIKNDSSSTVFANEAKQTTVNNLDCYAVAHNDGETVRNISDLKIDILLGGTKKSERKQILENIKTGKTNIIIGTHALFQNDVQYKNLGFVIIDEQHRFGVLQRAELIQLAKKSMEKMVNDKWLMINDENSSSTVFTNSNEEARNKIAKSNFMSNKQAVACPHILFMSATPIPRTMTMMFYGDLDVSFIRTQPKNRLPIKTRVSFDFEREQIFDFAKNELKKGHQIYIVFPLVAKSEKLELKSAIEHFEIIQNEIFPYYSCGLLHGQMKWQEKEEIMISFKENKFQILVATTVVEVGIDVPNATVMIIEDSERFGLSQLHQLRGRVGRGAEQSYCFLMTKDNFKYNFVGKKNINSEDEKINAIIRLKTMQETTDGFKLSEVDLKLRGPGDMLGTKQSGVPEFKYADLVNDVEIVQTASKLAKQIAAEDPNLEKIANQKLKEHFEKYYNSEKFVGIG